MKAEDDMTAALNHVGMKAIGGRERITADERERVRAFLLHLAEWSGKSWDELIFEARVPSTTAHGWRYKQATPHAPALLELLRAAGVLDDDYQLVVPNNQ